MSSVYSAVIFDLDGTLLDTLDDLTDAVNHTLERRGFPKRTLQEVRGVLGNGYAYLIAHVLPEGVPQSVADEALAEFNEYYTAHCQVKTRPYPGVIELLRDLQLAGYGLAIVSNKGAEAVGELADLHFAGLIDKDKAIGRLPGLKRKPAPDMVLEALSRLGVPPRSTLYVGDSEVDFATAANASLDCVLVSWGFRSRRALEELGATTIIDSPLELKTILSGRSL